MLLSGNMMFSHIITIGPVDRFAFIAKWDSHPTLALRGKTLEYHIFEELSTGQNHKLKVLTIICGNFYKIIYIYVYI